MTTEKKGTAARLYIGDAEIKILKELSEATNLSQTMVMSQIVTAGLRACAEAGNRLPLPLSFQIVGPNDPWRMNEERHQPQKRK